MIIIDGNTIKKLADNYLSISVSDTNDVIHITISRGGIALTKCITRSQLARYDHIDDEVDNMINEFTR